MFSVGIQISCFVHVGNCIGNMKVHMAQVFAKVASMVGIIWALASSLALIIFSKYFILLYSSDPEINAILENVMLVIALFIFFDCSQIVI